MSGIYTSVLSRRRDPPGSPCPDSFKGQSLTWKNSVFLRFHFSYAPWRAISTRGDMPLHHSRRALSSCCGTEHSLWAAGPARLPYCSSTVGGIALLTLGPQRHMAPPRTRNSVPVPVTVLFPTGYNFSESSSTLTSLHFLQRHLLPMKGLECRKPRIHVC